MAKISCLSTEEESNLELVTPFPEREVVVAFHDIDGTHSLIREWEPVMSAVLSFVIKNGLGTPFDRALAQISENLDLLRTEETDSFCVESAGLSALTQMEWAIRRGVEVGTIVPKEFSDTPEAHRINSEIIQKIWQGEERFDLGESPRFTEFIEREAPSLFRLYEQVLYETSRNRNIEIARSDPDRFLVPGSVRFLSFLQQKGVVNYFITGAVVEKDGHGQARGGIYDEVVALGLEVGTGKLVENIYGSTWERKEPKVEVMHSLCDRLAVVPSSILVVGDGRSEIDAGHKMGSVCISRLGEFATRHRQLHRALGTHLIVADFSDPGLYGLFE